MMPKEKSGPAAEPSPDETLKALLREKANCNVEFCSYNAPLLVEQGFFHHPKQEEIDAYQHDVIDAVRSSDMETLRRFHEQKRPLKCSNAFGESILHLACRKHLVSVVKFLTQTAQVPVCVCDDYGRTPVHDACWVHKPDFELMDLLLGECPDLLYIKDRRGHTPLSFARRDQWKEWNAYLKRKSADFLMPRVISFKVNDAVDK
jgi:ankyrin repeat protein